MTLRPVNNPAAGVAQRTRTGRLATLLIDLLTLHEEVINARPRR